MWFTDQIAAGELLVEYHKYHSNFEQSVSSSSKRYFLGFQDYGGEGVDVSYSDKYLSFRLCYSLHSSFAEITDVLKTLQPKRVTPIAAPLTSQMTPKRLFQIIDHYIAADRKESSTTKRLSEKIQRKPVNAQLQVKQRYDSLMSKAERKRRKKLRREEEQQKQNDAALDLDLDNHLEQNLLQRVDSLRKPTKKIVKVENPPETVDLPKIEFEFTSAMLPLSDSKRERTTSDTSSATIDYNFQS